VGKNGKKHRLEFSDNFYAILVVRSNPELGDHLQKEGAPAN
jgi:hypothetical protein